MNGVVQIGPLAMATDRLLAVVAILIFIYAMDRIALAAGKDGSRAGGLALVGGLLAARIGYVAQHFDAYARDWWSAFAFWQGGFNLWAGVAVAAGIITWRVRPRPATMQALALLLALVVAWSAAWSMVRPAPRPLPDLPQMVRMDGSPFPAQTLTGKPLVINLWATWCPPCRRELPMLAEVAAKAEIPVLLVNQGEGSGTVSRHLRQAGISGQSILLDQQGVIAQANQSSALPTTLFVDADGNIVETHVGEISRAMVLAKIAELQAAD